MKNSILIVEDNPKNLQLIASVLDPYYHLYLADNGEKALKTAEVKLPDLILLDILMPVENGYEICKKLKCNKKTEDIPVIFLTVKDGEDDIALGYELGGADYITKPFKTKEVLARIKTQIELKNFRDKLQMQNEELKKLLLSRDKFFSIIAHDLRAPFIGFLGLTEMMATQTADFSNEEIAKYLKKLNSTGVNLYNLLENLLEWSMIQRGMIQYKPEIVSVDTIIQECVNSIVHEAEHKLITINYVPTNSIRVIADKNMLTAILRNLLTNAIKFTHRNGEINITIMDVDNNFTQIAVSDNGVGISKTDISKLFSINENVSSPGTENEPSTGLGLVLCQEFVQMHGSHLNVDSEINKGTTFSFQLKKSIEFQNLDLKRLESNL
jgi:signal transduction histidine kinase